MGVGKKSVPILPCTLIARPSLTLSLTPPSRNSHWRKKKPLLGLICYAQLQLSVGHLTEWGEDVVHLCCHGSIQA